MDNKSQKRKQAERRRALQLQRNIRVGAILLALALAIAALAQSCSTRRAINELAAQLRAKKLQQAQEALLAAQAQEPEQEAEAETVREGVQVTLSFVGDCTLGVDDNREDGSLIAEYYDSNGAAYFFQNVRSIFEGDDLTAASLVGSLTVAGERQNWNAAYRGAPAYAEILTAGGVDAVTPANEHWNDFSDEGYVDTLANLDKQGVTRFAFENTATVNVAGTSLEAAPAAPVTVGFLGVWQDSDENYQQQALADIETLKEKGAQIIVAVAHWVSENPDAPEERQIHTAHKLIDAGADLVLGVQPYTLQGVEVYHDKYIVYSLGSFLTADPEPDSTDTMIFQQTFTVSGGAAQGVADYEIIPCSVTSGPGNTCCPTPLTGGAQQRVLERIYDLSAELDGGISPKE